MSFLVAALLLSGVHLPAVVAPAVGLRVVLDVSASMAVGDRLGEAVTFAERANSVAAENQPFCSEFMIVDNHARLLAGVQELRSVQATAVGADVLTLVRAAESELSSCDLTHVLVISDNPRPAPYGDQDGVWLWQQVGSPESNAGIAGVSAGGGLLSGLPPAITFDIVSYPPASSPPVLEVLGPDGPLAPAVRQQPDRAGAYSATVPYAGAGQYEALLGDGGALPGDDRVVVQVPDLVSAGVDWQLPDLAPPRGMAHSEDSQALLVAPLADDAQADRQGPSLLFIETSAASGGRIGTFVEHSALLDGVSMDVLESVAPAAGDVPAGFIPLLSEENTGRAWLAVRSQPPAVIVPAPILDSGDDARNLTLVLFYNAVRWLLGRTQATLSFEWTTPEGHQVTDAGRESNTAQEVAPSLQLEAFRPAPVVSEAEPLWPWLLLAALLLIAVERLLGVHWRKEAVHAV